MPSSTGTVDCVLVSVDVALVTLTCAMLNGAGAVCVFELLNTQDCTVQLLLLGVLAGCWLVF